MRPDVHYRTVDSPVGRLLVAATEDGRRADRVRARGRGRGAAVARRPDRPADPPHPAPARRRRALVRRVLRRRARPVRAAARHPPRSRVPPRGARPPPRRCPTAQRVSYAALAARTSSPNAVRAVGTACATNPLPLVIPCHRVTRSDGSVGAYLGGPETKVRLLALEATGTLHAECCRRTTVGPDPGREGGFRSGSSSATVTRMVRGDGGNRTPVHC